MSGSEARVKKSLPLWLFVAGGVGIGLAIALIAVLVVNGLHSGGEGGKFAADPVAAVDGAAGNPSLQPPGDVEEVTWKDKAEIRRDEYGDVALYGPGFRATEGLVTPFFGWTEETTTTSFLNEVRPWVTDELFAQLKEQGGPWQWNELKGKVVSRSVKNPHYTNKDFWKVDDPPTHLEVVDKYADGSTKTTKLVLTTVEEDVTLDATEDRTTYSVTQARVASLKVEEE